MRIHDDPRRYIFKPQDLAPEHSRLYWQQYIFAVITGVFLITGPILLTFSVIKFITDAKPYVAVAEVVIYLVVMILAVNMRVPLRLRKPMLIYALIGMSVMLTIHGGPYRSGIAFVLLACALAGLLMSLHEILILLGINLLISLVISWAVLSGRLEGYPVHLVYESWGIIVASTSVIGGVITLIVFTTMKGLHQQASIIHAQIQDINSIFDSIMDAVFVINSEGSIEQHNRQASIMCLPFQKHNPRSGHSGHSDHSDHSDHSTQATEVTKETKEIEDAAQSRSQGSQMSLLTDTPVNTQEEESRKLVGRHINELFDLCDPETGDLYRGRYGVGLAGLVLDVMSGNKDLITFQGSILPAGTTMEQLAAPSKMKSETEECSTWNKRHVSCTVKRVDNGTDTFMTQEIPFQDRVVMICRDTTEQVQEQTTRMHRERIQAVGKLAGGMAHDFNNSLMGIFGYLELLEDELNELCLSESGREGVCEDGGEGDSTLTTKHDAAVLADEGGDTYAERHMKNRSDVDVVIDQIKRYKVLQGYVQEIKMASKGAAELVKQVQMQSRQKESPIELIDMHVCIRDTVRFLSRTVDRTIAIAHDLKASDFWVSGNLEMIKSAMLNLGINARDAMPSGGHLSIFTKVVEVTEQLQFDGFVVKAPVRSGPHLCVTFRDTGVGMDADLMIKVFEPFFTTKIRGKGTGFGLSSVLSALDTSNGFVVVRSWVENGTEFKLYFPLVTESEQEPSHGQKSTAQSDHAHQQVRSHGAAKGKVVTSDDQKHQEFISDSVLQRINTLPGIRVTRKHAQDPDPIAGGVGGSSPTDARTDATGDNSLNGIGGSEGEPGWKGRRGKKGGARNKRFQGVCLVADDEKPVREALSRALKSWGVKVFSAEDGYVALSRFIGHHKEIDLVLLDVNMPNMDGERTLTKFKAIDKDVRVIVITGFAEEEKLERMSQDPAVIGVLNKPFSMAQLEDAVGLVLARSH